MALNFVNWGLQEWGSVVFTDESTIFPKRMKSRVIWSQRGCHHHTDEEPNIKRLGIQVWAFITGVMVKKIFYGGGGARGKKTLLKKTFCMNPDQPGNWR